MQGEDWRGTPRRAAISSGQGRPDRSSAGESESESERSSSSASVEGRNMARNKGLEIFFFLEVLAGEVYWSRTGCAGCRMTESEARLSFAQEALGSSTCTCKGFFHVHVPIVPSALSRRTGLGLDLAVAVAVPVHYLAVAALVL